MPVVEFSRSRTTHVGCYGIHEGPDGLFWLIQAGKPTNAHGRAQSTPFSVQTESGSTHCNHMVAIASPVVNRATWSYFLDVIDHPLVRAFFPVPCGSTTPLYVPGQSRDVRILLKTLARLTSPINGIVLSWETGRSRHFLRKVRQSNIQPLVLTDVGDGIEDLLKMRGESDRFVLAGSGRPPRGVRQVRVDDLLSCLESLVELPMESIGSVLVRRAMRRELVPDASGSLRGLERKQADGSGF